MHPGESPRERTLLPRGPKEHAGVGVWETPGVLTGPEGALKACPVWFDEIRLGPQSCDVPWVVFRGSCSAGCVPWVGSAHSYGKRRSWRPGTRCGPQRLHFRSLRQACSLVCVTGHCTHEMYLFSHLQVDIHSACTTIGAVKFQKFCYPQLYAFWFTLLLFEEVWSKDKTDLRQRIEIGCFQQCSGCLSGGKGGGCSPSFLEGVGWCVPGRGAGGAGRSQGPGRSACLQRD